VIDLASLADGLVIFKSGMDGIRSAFQLARDVMGGLPADKATHLSEALQRTEEQFAIAEAQIAKGLGYELCHCAFPPTPMLTVGWKERDQSGPVHRCPKCGITDNAGVGWNPTDIISARAEAWLSPTKTG
jgi:hypothetical protein